MLTRIVGEYCDGPLSDIAHEFEWISPVSRRLACGLQAIITSIQP
jgi:hypothetical protein